MILTPIETWIVIPFFMLGVFWAFSFVFEKFTGIDMIDIFRTVLEYWPNKWKERRK